MTLNRREILTAGYLGLLTVGFGSYTKKAGAQTSTLPPKIYIDAHRHLLSGMFGSNVEEDIDKTLAWMDRYGVMQAVLLNAVSVGPGQKVDFSQAEQTLARISSFGDVFFPFCSFDPDTPYSQAELTEVLAHLKNLGVIGFGEFKAEGLRIDDPKCMAIYGACADAGLPVLLHTDGKFCFDDPGLPGLEKVLQTFPNHTFIAHAQGWWASISGDVATRADLNLYPSTKVAPGGAVQRLIDAYPNLFADLSANSGLNAIRRDPDYGPEFLIRNQDRLFFGSDTAPEPDPDVMPKDWPEFVRKGLFDNWGHFGFFPTLDLPPEVARKIYQDNVRRILNLPVPANPNRQLSG
jgi:predicted TIM-barrel fold metal-dependent hydrolase